MPIESWSNQDHYSHIFMKIMKSNCILNVLANSKMKYCSWNLIYYVLYSKLEYSLIVFIPHIAIPLFTSNQVNRDVIRWFQKAVKFQVDHNTLLVPVGSRSTTVIVNNVNLLIRTYHSVVWIYLPLETARLIILVRVLWRKLFLFEVLYLYFLSKET